MKNFLWNIVVLAVLLFAQTKKDMEKQFEIIAKYNDIL